MILNAFLAVGKRPIIYFVCLGFLQLGLSRSVLPLEANASITSLSVSTANLGVGLGIAEILLPDPTHNFMNWCHLTHFVYLTNSTSVYYSCAFPPQAPTSLGACGKVGFLGGQCKNDAILTKSKDVKCHISGEN